MLMDGFGRRFRRYLGSGIVLGACAMGMPSGAWAQDETQLSEEYKPADVAEAQVFEPPQEEEETEEPWVITDVFTDECGDNCFTDNGWIMGGHMQWGYQNNPDGAFTGNGPFLSQKEWDRFNLNQQYFYLGKVADGSEGLDWGFRTDIFYGVDGNEGQSFGNINPGHYDYLNGWDHGIYEWAMPQLYGEVAMGDTSLKIGHFYTTLGYEVIPSTGNFFLSRQLTFYNSEPFTHTGAMLTQKFSDKLTAHACYTYGMDTGFYQFNQGNAFLGGFTYQIDDDTSFIYCMTGGNLGWRGDGAINSMILTRNWTDAISTVHQFDVLQTNLGSNFNDPSSFIAGDSIGFINYAFYNLTDTLKAGVRGEWYKADGVDYYTVTYGVNFFPNPNLRIRPEVRHMFSPNDDNYFGAGGYDDQLFNQAVFGIDAILTF